MQYIADLGVDKIKVYYNDSVYSPEFSSLGTILIADKLIKDGGNPKVRVLDYGCGTGLLGLGVKKLNPEVHLILCDIDYKAVKVSRLNSKRLGLECSFSEGLIGVDIIVANLPTFSEEDMAQALHGPRVAYYSKEPLKLYEELFKKAQCKAIVAECQTKYQKDFLKLALKYKWVLVLQTEMSFGFIKTF